MTESERVELALRRVAMRYCMHEIGDILTAIADEIANINKHLRGDDETS